MVVEFVVGLMINSLARQADAFHMASDVASMAIGWYASHVTGGAKTARATFGHRRHEIVGALINCVFLLSICFTIIIDALQRIPKYEEIAADLSSEVDLLLIVGGVGLGINILGLFVFTVGHGHSHGGGGGGHGHSHGGGGDHGHSHSGGGGGGGHGHSHGGGDHGHLAAASGLEPSVGPDDGGHGHHDHGDHAGHSHTSGDGHAHDDGDSHAHGVALPASHAEAAPEQRQRFSLNIQGVLLHVAGDALGSIAVIFSGLLVKYLSSPLRGLADPLCSLAIVFLLIGGTLSPLRRCLAIVTQGAPAHVDVPGLEARLRSVTHVLAVSLPKVDASVQLKVHRYTSSSRHTRPTRPRRSTTSTCGSWTRSASLARSTSS